MARPRSRGTGEGLRARGRRSSRSRPGAEASRHGTRHRPAASASRPRAEAAQGTGAPAPERIIRAQAQGRLSGRENSHEARTGPWLRLLPGSPESRNDRPHGGRRPRRSFSWSAGSNSGKRPVFGRHCSRRGPLRRRDPFGARSNRGGPLPSRPNHRRSAAHRGRDAPLVFRRAATSAIRPHRWRYHLMG
jgi:hypothetical protein